MLIFVQMQLFQAAVQFRNSEIISSDSDCLFFSSYSVPITAQLPRAFSFSPSQKIFTRLFRQVAKVLRELCT